MYKSVVISSGHGLHIRGASGILDEVNEARKVVDQLAHELEMRGVEVIVFHDDVSTSQGENLDRIVAAHNAENRELDISVHFNCYDGTAKGTEVLYVTDSKLAAKLSEAISDAGGFVDRGAKHRGDLAFLNNTDEYAVLIEVCFVDSKTDADLYRENFDEICDAIADVIGGEDTDDGDDERPDRPERPQPPGEHSVVGKVSWFGGPDDDGVSPSEGLAFIYQVEDAPHLFLPYQPEGTTGLARRLNPHIHYIACRWNYDDYPKTELLHLKALVRNAANGMALTAFCADWGPHASTDRVADLSPGLMEDLQLTTDDVCEIVFPFDDDED